MCENRLLIVVADPAWTRATLHLACSLSRRNLTEIVLLKLVPVRHPLLLGTTEGSLDLTPADGANVIELVATAEDYGVALEVVYCQFANYWRAIVDAADQLAATAVIAHIPPSHLPFWHRAHRWLLQHRLARQHRMLITLDALAPSLSWTPSLALQEDLAVRLSGHHIP